VEQVLTEYFIADNILKIMDMPFNVGHNRAATNWHNIVTKRVAALSGSGYKHVIVFITTHSDPRNGDLWLGKDEEGENCATTVTNVSTSLFYHFILILTMNSTVVECYFATVRAYTERFNRVHVGLRSGRKCPQGFC
jgi:hypothetical protein